MWLVINFPINTHSYDQKLVVKDCLAIGNPATSSKAPSLEVPSKHEKQSVGGVQVAASMVLQYLPTQFVDFVECTLLVG